MSVLEYVYAKKESVCAQEEGLTCALTCKPACSLAGVLTAGLCRSHSLLVSLQPVPLYSQQRALQTHKSSIPQRFGSGVG